MARMYTCHRDCGGGGFLLIAKLVCTLVMWYVDGMVSSLSAKRMRLSARHVLSRLIGGGMTGVECVWSGDWCDCFCELHSSVSMFVVVGPPAIICL